MSWKNWALLILATASVASAAMARDFSRWHVSKGDMNVVRASTARHYILIAHDKKQNAWRPLAVFMGFEYNQAKCVEYSNTIRFKEVDEVLCKSKKEIFPKARY